MAKFQHLFNSSGEWIAFRIGKYVFDNQGIWIGWTPWDYSEVVDIEGQYLGHIFLGDRFYHKYYTSYRGYPGYPGYPGFKGYSRLPSGYEDVVIPKNN